MVAYLRRRIDEFGIDLEDLALTIESEKPARTEARYRNAAGDIWDGRGEMPQWLKQALARGAIHSIFRVAS
ncbi:MULTISPECIES: H-NS histone family protein [unclassified Paraburkholderia]|uniref:H-NS histone family protein n=1 Tax=unclassified Paraburkholderia TaxID=2615204 RepID=UPI0038BCC40D